MSLSKRRFSDSNKLQVKSSKFLVPILAIIILAVVAVIVSWHWEQKSESNQSNIPDNTKIEVVNGEGSLPSAILPDKNQDITNSPQQGPATVQDLGGDATSPSSIEDLLKDKEIQIK